MDYCHAEQNSLDIEVCSSVALGSVSLENGLGSDTVEYYTTRDPLAGPGSPANRLPVELLLMIFLHCIRAPLPPTLGPRFTPMVLSHVCRRWRQCACTSSALWRHMAVVDSVDSVDSDDILVGASPNLRKLTGLTFLLQEFVPRAGDCLLDLLSFVVDYDTPDSFEACLQTWRECLPRCRSLHFKVTETLRRKLFEPPVQLPSLESLSFGLPLGFHDSVLSLDNVVAPRLTHISLQDIGYRTSVVLERFYPRLTVLELQSVSYSSSLIGVLQRCQSLMHLTLDTLDVTAPVSATLSLAHLRIVNFVVQDELEVFPILLSFRFPGLRSLGITARQLPPMMARNFMPCSRVSLPCWNSRSASIIPKCR
ncbi:hypothetical protein NEOLEDRAFT_301036 [Neolentinus lepideus HHB14362 ss-1]|uniref:F-box domain-containing protein n=1 Tax=Neolentinus lepideus HHB14362 ss-1 TaxID=1314782 RepID=A0A165VQG2_9AGAM|nr:hypothetical protein NEOLEDRAFT_301036 [Neolentinus lepideus HHB14362 ss-1]